MSAARDQRAIATATRGSPAPGGVGRLLRLESTHPLDTPAMSALRRSGVGGPGPALRRSPRSRCRSCESGKARTCLGARARCAGTSGPEPRSPRAEQRPSSGREGAGSVSGSQDAPSVHRRLPLGYLRSDDAFPGRRQIEGGCCEVGRELAQTKKNHSSGIPQSSARVPDGYISIRATVPSSSTSTPNLQQSRACCGPSTSTASPVAGSHPGGRRFESG